MTISLTQALFAAIAALTTTIAILWREMLKWQERWAEEVRQHSKSTELLLGALEQQRSESSKETLRSSHH